MSDLRRSATAVKRHHDHKAKWAHGARRYGQHQPATFDKWTIDAAVPVRQRPAPTPSAAAHSAMKRNNEPTLRSARNANLTYFHSDVKEVFSCDSSSSDETIAPESSPILDEIPAYAISGNTILATAVSKAEVKYENKVTEKLAQEYEFISREDDNAPGYAADVDDFEIIDHDSV